MVLMGVVGGAAAAAELLVVVVLLCGTAAAELLVAAGWHCYCCMADTETFVSGRVVGRRVAGWWAAEWLVLLGGTGARQ